ncbi:MAG: FAD-dependent oxidoreductase, partial [Ignavibacteriales bacterium]|nr:FAD-dependent oxidoreductase [Ignavibacteriales bacterium]
LLIERDGFVGGTSTAGLVTPFMKYWIDDGTSRRPLVAGIFAELNDRMIAAGGMVENGFSPTAFRRVAADLLADAGVTILVQTMITDVLRSGKTLRAVSVHNGVSGRTLSASVFIDTTGDGDLLFLAEAPWKKGDEKTGLLQALTMFFRVGGIVMEDVVQDVARRPGQFFDWSTKKFVPGQIVSVAGYHEVVERAKQRGALADAVQYFFFTSLPASGEGAFNTTNILGLDGSSSVELTRAEISGRRQVTQVVALLKSECSGFQHSYLIETGIQVGVRETRRAVGDYVMTGGDIRSGAKFPDAVARGNYGVDIHGQKDEKSVMEYLREGDYYEVPARALFVQQTENLLTAGRSISSTREGQAALRIQATAAATGEAAGVIASQSLVYNGTVRSVPYASVRGVLSKSGNV